MADVIVYQMGKVASESICESLKNNNIDALSSHFLGEDNLKAMLRTLINPDSEDTFIHHNTAQLIKNIEITRKIGWYKKYKKKDGEKLKIITLARDPASWYRANFIQNFEGYRGAVTQWVEKNYPNKCDPDDLLCHLRVFYAAVFDGLANIEAQPGSAEFRSATMALLQSEIARSETLVRHINILNRPLIWFDQFFAPTVEVDVFEDRSEIESGYKFFENDFCCILLIRYEDLGRAHDVIGKFVQAAHFTLNELNISKGKPFAAECFEAFETIKNYRAALEKIYASKYCEYFGYTAESHFSVD